MPNNKFLWQIIAWAVLGVAALYQLVYGLRVESDLTAFMPQARTEQQMLLLGELEAGASSRIWLLAMEVAPPTGLASLSNRLAGELTDSKLFSNVYFGQTVVDQEVRELFFQYRYLFDPGGDLAQFSTDALRRAFEQNLEKLASPLSSFEKVLVTSDPTAALTRVIQGTQFKRDDVPSRNGVWMSRNGETAFLVAETHAGGTDLEAQEIVRDEIERAFNAIRNEQAVTLQLSGAAAFAVATKDRIKQEALNRSLLSFMLLTGILLFVYRKPSLVLLAWLPLGGGLLIALAITSLAWDAIHGITIAFGATLLGVAIDYPVHVISHARAGQTLEQSILRVWGTMKLGVLTTVLGFTAMLSTDFPAIRQLAIFSVSGLIGAALITRFVLPLFVFRSGQSAPRLLQIAGRVDRLSSRIWWLIPVILLIGLALVWPLPGALISTDIGELSPVPDYLRQQDRELRLEMGVPEPRYVMLVQGDSVEAVLQQQEEIAPVIAEAIQQKYLADAEMAANLLPSRDLQLSRQSLLPDRDSLIKRIADAQLGLPFRPGAFQAFIDDVDKSRTLGPLGLEAFSSTLLGSRLENLIRQANDRVIGVVPLIGLERPREFTALAEAAAPGKIYVLDLKASANELINAYRDDIVLRSALALVFIAAILLFVLRDIRRSARVIAPVLGAVFTAATIPILLGQSLTLFHLVALLLVVGIGLDYALFFSRSSTDETEFASTQHSVLVCAVSTVTVFSLLATSDIPVLNAIGVTVAVGSVTAYILSSFLTQRATLGPRTT